MIQKLMGRENILIFKLNEVIKHISKPSNKTICMNGSVSLSFPNHHLKILIHQFVPILEMHILKYANSIKKE